MESRTPLNIAATLVAIGLIGTLGFVTWALVFVQVPQGNRDTLTVVVGILSANVGLVVGFFFGSTVTNHRKDVALEKQATALQSAQQALTPSEPAIPVEPGQRVTVEGQES